jgi:cyclopropane-fatty-acyl-phospholipid synthase
MATLMEPSQTATSRVTVSQLLVPLLDKLFDERLPVMFEFWDASTYGRETVGRLRFTSPDALRSVLWSPDELGVARAFVTGSIDVSGNVAQVLRGLQQSLRGDIGLLLRSSPQLLRAVRATGGLGARPSLPDEEILPRGVRHSLGRDRQAISHHYDVGNSFYELVLGSSMTYSCARFVTPDMTLHDAQAAKHELICRKLGLGEPGAGRMRLLEIGCGWGSMAIHAASNHGADVVGVTISEEQACYARARVARLGLDDRVEIRVQDYREVTDGPFDAISSIGMAEHVGKRRMALYFERLYGLLRPGGRLLNHAISSVGGSRLPRRSFAHRYVFPDGELLDVGDTVLFMEQAGFEVRDVQNLREHYAQTLRCWVANLEQNWDAAVDLVGEARARVWLLYMSGSINGFDDAGLHLHQTLGVRLHADGRSDMPPTRRGWS